MKRKLGRSDIEVSALGMGCWAIGGPFWREGVPVGWGEVDDDESIRSIHRALEMGITFFDTADVYGTGHSERVLARALEGKRSDVVIATKFANVFDESTRQITGSSVEPDYIQSACDASLKRLNTDYIDLYQLHDGGLDMEKAVEVRDTLEDLVTAGKIRGYGWSTDDHERAALFAEGAHCIAVQHEINVLNDNPAMIDLCESQSIASINRGPLAMGLLTGKYKPDSTLPDDDVRGEKAPPWMRYFSDGKPNAEFYQRMEAVRDVLTSGGRTLAQGALAWLWARTEMTVPIPGFKTIQQVEENTGAMQFGALTTEQMAQIDMILDR